MKDRVWFAVKLGVKAAITFNATRTDSAPSEHEACPCFETFETARIGSGSVHFYYFTMEILMVRHMVGAMVLSVAIAAAPHPDSPCGESRVDFGALAHSGYTFAATCAS